MDSNICLLQRLFTSLNEHDPLGMSECYHPKAAFSDIAFDLHGREEIGAMWRMICVGDITAAFDIIRVDGNAAQVRLVDDYTFVKTPGSSSKGRRVHNIIDSHFRFEQGMIIEHRDYCDPRIWAAMALGGITGFLAGRIHYLRSYSARRMLQRFNESRPVA
jgi:limonene-1,2-epoxide hydrolase